MKNRFLRLAIIIIILIMILISSEGFLIKYENMKNDNNLITAFDYYNFKEKANLSGYKIDEKIEELKKLDVNSVLVKEINLYDLKINGDIYYDRYGFYISGLLKTNPELVKIIEKEIGRENANEYGFLITTAHGDIDILLKERLSNRYNEEYYKRFLIDGTYYHYLNINTENAKPSLGFDEKLIDKLSKEGFNIVLMPYNDDYKNYDYINEYESIIERYDVKHVIFETDTLPGYPNRHTDFIDIFRANQVVIAVIERYDQIMYIPQKGIEDIIKGIDYALTRVYFVPEYNIEGADSITLSSLWSRAVIDRNIRLIVLQQAFNSKIRFSENFDNTMEAIKTFQEDISKYDLNYDSPIKAMNNEKASWYHELSIIILLTLMIFLFLIILNKKYFLLKTSFTILVGTSFIILKYLLDIKINSLLALLAAIVIPTLGILGFLKIIKIDFKKYKYLKYVILSGYIFTLSLLGGYIINTSLYEVIYLHNISIFRGVKLAFMIPMILYIFTYFILYMNFNSTKELILGFIKREVTYLAFIGMSILGLAAILYLLRSGNGLDFLVSGFEIKIRNILENILSVRPRFKEFLFGYPALIVGVYLYNKYKKNFIIFISGFFVTSLSVSIVNTFSHTAADMSRSFKRTLYGLLMGVIVSMIIIFCIKYIGKIYKYFTKKITSI